MTVVQTALGYQAGHLKKKKKKKKKNIKNIKK